MVLEAECPIGIRDALFDHLVLDSILLPWLVRTELMLAVAHIPLDRAV